MKIRDLSSIDKQFDHYTDMNDSKVEARFDTLFDIEIIAKYYDRKFRVWIYVFQYNDFITAILREELMQGDELIWETFNYTWNDAAKIILRDFKKYKVHILNEKKYKEALTILIAQSV